MGFSGSSVGGAGGIEYLANGDYLADGSINASGGPYGVGSPGDLSVAVAYTLYKGIIKKEDRSNKEFKLSIGDYTHRIFRDIPPRKITVTEFPHVGTSVMVEGTMTDFDTDLVGKKIPYIWGDFTDAPLIQPLFIDTVRHRYLFADHAIGTVVKVYSGGTQVFNYTTYISGTHTGTNIMSFIDFGTSQGTKSVYAEIRGREGNTSTLLPIYGTVSLNGTETGMEKDVYIGPYGGAASSVYIKHKDRINYAGTQRVWAGCWVKQYEPNAAFVHIRNEFTGQPYAGTSDATTIGTWQWVQTSWDKTGTTGYGLWLEAYSQNTGVHFDGFRTIIGTTLIPTETGQGTGLATNGDFDYWTSGFGTVAGTRAPDGWYSTWTNAPLPTITVAGTGIVGFGSSYGTQVIELLDYYNSGVITNPVLMLKDILTSGNLCGLSTSDIGTASFDTAEVWLNNINFRYIMNGEKHSNSIDLIQDMSVNGMSSFYFDKENQANFQVYRPAVSRTNIRKIQQNEILEDSFSITRDVRDVFNRVVVNYDYDWIKEEYRNAFETSGTAFVEQFNTIRTFTIDSPFVFSYIEASNIGRRWLSKLQGGLSKVNFSLPMSVLPLDIGERVLVTHEEPPTADGGWTDRLINITEFSLDNRNKSIDISAIDEDEVNIYKRYFILGDGTAFWRSATEAQRFYGALCSVGGTFSNGDSGCRLW